MLRLRHLAFLALGVPGALGAYACGGDSGGDSGGSGGSGGGATGGAGGTVEGGKPDEQAPGAQPPAKPSDNPAAGSGDTVVALNKLLLGDTDENGNADPNYWRKLGFNLDGLISTKNGTNHCKGQEGSTKSSIQTDGENGIDNSFGSNLMPIIGSLTSNASQSISDSLMNGDFTIMLKLDKLEDPASKPDQTAIAAALYGGAKLTTPPKWDGTDSWPVLPELLSNPTDINSSKVKFPDSYVAGGTWVSGSEGDLNLTVSIQGFTLALKITKARLAMNLTGVGSTVKATKGVIAGVIPTEQLISELKKVAGGFDPNLCEGATFESIAGQIRAASDIMQDGTNGDPTKTCDGISVGLGFEGMAVQLGGIAPAANPPKDPCAGDAGTN
jgi:hypothetical protein